MTDRFQICTPQKPLRWLGPDNNFHDKRAEAASFSYEDAITTARRWDGWPCIIPADVDVEEV